MKGASLKALQELFNYADIKMTRRNALLSQAQLKEPVSLLNSLPSGKEVVNIGRNGKGADNRSVANPS